MGRIALAVVLVYLLLFKALFLPFPGLMMPAAPGLFSAWVLCSHDERVIAAADDNRGSPVSPNDNCCDDGCLMRIDGSVPLILIATLITFCHFWRRAIIAPAPAKAASGPPWRIASRQQAPRAPPQLSFV